MTRLTMPRMAQEALEWLYLSAEIWNITYMAAMSVPMST